MSRLPYPKHLIIERTSLTASDRSRIGVAGRPDHNRLGFGYQLAFVRLTGRFPVQQPFAVDMDLLLFVAHELSIDAQTIWHYTRRQPTISQHQESIRRYLSLTRFEDFDLGTLRRFVCREAFRIEQPSGLRAKTEQFLRDRRVLLPATSTLSRLVGTEREQARRTVFTRLCEDVSPQLRHRLDRMLVVGTDGYSELNRLKEPPRSASPKAMLHLIERLRQIKQSGVLGIDLAWLNNNFQKCMARRVRHSDIHRLKLLEPSHRHTALVCFLSQAHRDTIDAVIMMHSRLMTDVHRRAKEDLDDEIKKKRTSIRTLLDSFSHIGCALLDEELEPDALRPTVFERISPDRLKEQLLEAQEWTTGKKSHSFVGVVNRFGYLRQFSPALLEHISFAIESTGDSSILEAIEVLRQMNADGKRKLPANVPLDFVPSSIRPFVQTDGGIDRHGYEAAVLTALRDEIKRGNLWVPGSKRFCRLDDFFIPDSQWAVMREGFFRRAKLPADPKELVHYLTKRLNSAYDRFLATLPDNSYVTMEEDGWHFATEPAEDLSPEQETKLERLESWLKDKMRPIRLPDLLIEVDNDLYFTGHFIPSARRDDRTVEDVCSVIATLLAYAQNLGPKTMARMADGIGYKDILRISEWHLHEDTLRGALADVVNGISSLDTACVWGEGKTSSSDGQRFLFSRKVLSRTYSHRLGDFALEFYTFIADNFAPFYGVPKECTERDAPYALDGILYHESDLDPEEHYTDTHGYIELNFLGFAMFNKKFCPRIKGLSRQWIYRIDKNKDYGPLKPLVCRADRTIHMDWIVETWDKIGQFFASLEVGHATASVALKRLVSYGPKNTFHRGALEVSRVFKTEYILTLLCDPKLRTRQRRGLLKGEQVNGLARNVFYGKRGRADWPDFHRQMCSASCLTLILACIVYWQIREIERVLAESDLEADGIDDSLLEHISPVAWDNVLLYGQYRLNRDLVRRRPPLRGDPDAREALPTKD